jgi:8-oxo-dGTP pyrophosphatase MutT (NUDIX family)
MVLRDVPHLEVLMLRRNARSTFVGGGMVFPGGAVDPHDEDPGLRAVAHGRTDADADAALRVPGGGLAYWAAAVRETFEEAGLLLGCGAVDPGIGARLAARRLDVELGRCHLGALAADEGLGFDLGAVHYFGHWITPPGNHRRYDARFFVSAAPADQEPVHDDREAVAWEWVRPLDMLARVRAGEAWMLPPTEACLRALTQATSAAALLGDLAARPAGPPRLVADRGGVRIRLAHDPAVHSDDDADEVHDHWEHRCPT